MSCLIIFKKDLKKSSKKLMKHFYDVVHDDYFLEEDNVIEKNEIFKKQRKYYDENIIKEFLEFYKHKRLTSEIYKNLVKMETKDLLKKIETEIEDETRDYKIVYNFLSKMDDKLKIDKSLEFEIDEDLFCLKKTFFKAFELYHYDYYNLEN